MRIPDYPYPGRDLSGSELFAGWQDGHQIKVETDQIVGLAVQRLLGIVSPGASAYASWVALPGNGGKTLDEFFEFLRGPQGPTTIVGSIAEGMASVINGQYFVVATAGSFVCYQRVNDAPTVVVDVLTPVTLDPLVLQHISRFGVDPDSEADQTAAINAALVTAAQQGVAVLTRPGERYFHAGVIDIPNGTRWAMNGAELVATSPLAAAVFVHDDVLITGGGKFSSPNATDRASNIEASTLVLVGDTITIERPEVDGAASIGILLFEAANVRLVRPFVHDTIADGIHITYGTDGWVIEHPELLRTGDDMIAAVAYIGDGRVVQNGLIIGGRGIVGGARGLSILGARSVRSIGFQAIACAGAGVYVGSEEGSTVSSSIYGTSQVSVELPQVIGCCTDTTLGHAGVMVFGRDGTDQANGNEQISRHALDTRIAFPNVGGGAGAGDAYRIGYGAEGTQIVMPRARDVSNAGRQPNFMTINGRDTVVTDPQAVSIGGNGIIVGPQASGFVTIVRPAMEQMGLNNPGSYQAVFACDPATAATRIEITGARIRSSAGLPNLLGGAFPDGALVLTGCTLDDLPVAEINPIAELYRGGNVFDFSAGGQPKPRTIITADNGAAQYRFDHGITALIDIVAQKHTDQNLKLIATEALYYSSDDGSGVAGTDFVALPGGGYYRRQVLGPMSGAAFSNLNVPRTLSLDGSTPVLSIGAATGLDLTVRAVLTKKMG